MFDIDFVVTWVDSNDAEWKEVFSKYRPNQDASKTDAGESRYRDWGLFKYWFRGIEKFAPWVRYIHFITFGHVPEWLDTSNEKIRIVRHEDYIPSHHLPVFNSNAIEMMMHKIPDLAEHFVYFNDDFYLTRPVTPEYFFHKGIPCDMAVISITRANGIMGGIADRNMSIIRKDFDVFRSVWMHPLLWFQPSYRKFLLNTFRGLLHHVFINPGDTHAPQPYLKSTWEKVWEKHGEELEATVAHRFRAMDDNSHWIYRYWQILEGNIVPRNIMRTTKVFYDVSHQLQALCDAIARQDYCVTIINDTPQDGPIDEMITKINEAFQSICPEKSSFEK